MGGVGEVNGSEFLLEQIDAVRGSSRVSVSPVVQGAGRVVVFVLVLLLQLSVCPLLVPSCAVLPGESEEEGIEVVVSVR